MPHQEVPLPRHAARTVTHGGQAGAELAALLPEITGPGGQFRHRQHIHLAFLAVRRYGMPEATTRICDWIQRIAVYERVAVPGWILWISAFRCPHRVVRKTPRCGSEESWLRQ